MHVGESANKKGVLEELLEMGMVLVALDARADGVDVPDHLGRDPQLRLNLSFRFGLPMALDPWGISATLTFGGVPYACRFPWTAIYLLVSHVNGEPYLFPDEVPAELLAQVGVESAWSIQPSQKAAKSQRPKLSVVQSPPDDADSATEPAADKEAPNKRGGRKNAASEPALVLAEAKTKGATAEADDAEADDEDDDDGHDARPSRDGTARTTRGLRSNAVRKLPRGPRAVEDLPPADADAESAAEANAKPKANAADHVEAKDDAADAGAASKRKGTASAQTAEDSARPAQDGAEAPAQAERTHADPPPQRTPPRRGHLRLVK